MRICYFGGYRPNYPRNSTQILALRTSGQTIIECQVRPNLKTISKILLLLKQFLSQPMNYDAIIVAEFNQTLVPLAWLLSRICGAALIFDPAISYYEDWVLIQKTISASSLQGLYYRLIDEVAFRLADNILWYMPDDIPYFAKIFPALNGKQVWSPPASDDRIFKPLPAKIANEQFIVHLNSSYLLTHGIEVVLQAAKIVSADPAIVFELFGRGPTYNDSVALAKSLQLTNVMFRDTVPITELPKAYAQADVCLGAFRDDAKLARLVELKIISALASRRPVIAADSPLKRKFFSPNEDIVLVPPGNPEALAQAIRKLKADPAWRERLAEAGLKTVQRHFSLEKIGQRMTEILTTAIARRRRIGQSPTRSL